MFWPKPGPKKPGFTKKKTSTKPDKNWVVLFFVLKKTMIYTLKNNKIVGFLCVNLVFYKFQQDNCKKTRNCENNQF